MAPPRGKDLGLMEVVEAGNLIRVSASDPANIIFGVVTDPALKDEVQPEAVRVLGLNVGVRL